MNKIVIFFLLLQMQSFGQNKFEVYFDFNKSDVNVLYQLKIDSLLTKNKTLEISKIEGFCDKVDSKSYNDKLALFRAQAVGDYLKSKNVVFATNYQITSFGENFKQSKNQSRNRKAVIYFAVNDLKSEIKAAKKGDYIKLKNINFENGTDELLNKSKPIILELVKILQEKKSLKIEIQGHICCQLPNFIDVISEARAKAVYNLLIYNKIDKSSLKFRGLGVSKPIYKIPEKDDYEREQNRRVEILIIEK